MRCPVCGTSETFVLETRHVGQGCITRRRQKCVNGHKFTTHETHTEEYKNLLRCRRELLILVKSAFSLSKAVSAVRGSGMLESLEIPPAGVKAPLPLNTPTPKKIALHPQQPPNPLIGKTAKITSLAARNGAILKGWRLDSLLTIVEVTDKGAALLSWGDIPIQRVWVRHGHLEVV